MGYLTPAGGYTKLITPVIGVHGAPFFLEGFFPLASTTSAIRLQAPGNPIIVTNPTPWGTETKTLLGLVSGSESETDRANVKYLIALDNKHFMALHGWIKEFPDAKVIGPDGLLKKTQNADGSPSIKFDYLFGSKSPETELPAELSNEFDTIFFPHSETQELALYHKPSSTLVTADLFPNLPAKRAFEQALTQSGNGFVWKWVHKYLFSLNYFKVDGSFAAKFIKKMVLPEDKASAQKLLDLKVDRIIMCHGDYIEDGAEAIIQKLLNPIVKKTN